MGIQHMVKALPVRVVMSILRILGSPRFSGPLLTILLIAPDRVRRHILTHLPPGANVDLVKRALQVLLGIAAVKQVNRGLNAMAANSWRVRPAPGWHWPNEVAVVTGGCSGIGYAITRRLVARRVKVAVLDVQAAPADFIANPLIRYYRCDITSPESVAEAADAIRRELGHPSILINNAGITRPMPILEISKDYLQKIFDVNCISHWVLVQQFLPHMIKVNKGHVVTIASVASFVALPRAADYSATKVAALAFHEALRLDLKNLSKADKVMTTVVHPNFVHTPLLNGFSDELKKMGHSLMTADFVAGRTTDQIFSRRGAQVIIPETQWMLTCLRGLPTWLNMLLVGGQGK